MDNDLMATCRDVLLARCRNFYPGGQSRWIDVDDAAAALARAITAACDNPHGTHVGYYNLSAEDAALKAVRDA